MKVYLDDERKEPEGWHRTHTAEETIHLLRHYRITHLSLDHDLAEHHYAGDYSHTLTGYDVLVWLEKEVASDNTFPVPETIEVHSMNPSGRGLMMAAIKRIKEMKKNGMA